MSAENEKTFITLAVPMHGFVVYGYGGGVNGCVYRGKPLLPFLQRLEEDFPKLRDTLNETHDSLDKIRPENPENQAKIHKLLLTGAWAYALTLELQPFQKACLHGPTNPLRHFILLRLEEIYTKCFAAAHMYGAPDESLIGLHGLLTDFEVNGGINTLNGDVGSGFHTSVHDYFMAYFAPNSREAIVYERFGELIHAITEIITTQYPKVVTALGAHINHLIVDEHLGFASSKFTSDTKTALIEKLKRLRDELTPPQASEKAA
ncbi:MAG: hypothetical protein RLZZ347_148 [Candidatus Parcubacteria bacterium]|jgi:hypothetical protein